MAEDFPTDVKQLIDQHIESLAQLETLLYLRQHADRWWDRNDIARAFAIAPEMSAAILADLVRRGFAVRADERFQYRTVDAQIDRTIVLLGDAYRERRLSVTTAIYAKPPSSVKTFADAFRFRKGD